MNLYFVPGINGLGKTKGVEKDSPLLKEFNFKKLILDNGNVKTQLDEIYSFFKKNENQQFFILGGDHSITYPIFKSFFERYGKKSKLLVFDAHFDLMTSMPEPTNEEWLRAVIEFGFDPKNILVVGVRRKSKNIDIRELNYVKKKKIKIIYPDEFEEKLGDILNFISDGKIYVSFDIDVFDSSIISSTAYPEKNGLNKKEVFSLLKKLFDTKNIFALDLVEINLNKGNEKNKQEAIEIAKKILKMFVN